MQTKRFFLRRRWWAGAVALVGLFAWSSWEEPSLHEYAPPTEFVTLNAPQLRPGPAAEQLQARLQALPGVTACALRPQKQLLTVAYNPDRLSAAELSRQLGGLQPLPVAAADPRERQCPVPAGYVQALERLRFALNLRRLYLNI